MVPSAAMPPQRRDAVAMVALVIALGAVTIAFGERIGVNYGQGWDGMSYTDWATAWWDRIMVAGTTQYQCQRVLPSAIVHYGLRALGMVPSVGRVIVAFQVFDVAMLAFAAALWARLGAAMGWRRAARWVGFVALFGCFANARHALYYPTLTDPAAFALGMVVAWAFLTDRPIALGVAAALGAVTWPVLTPIALVLLVLPRPGVDGVDAVPALEARWHRPVRWTALAIAAAASAAFVAIGLHYRAHPAPGVGRFTTWVRGDLLWLTVPLLIATIGAGTYVLLAQPRAWNVMGYLRRLAKPRLVAAIVAAIAIELARAWWIRRTGTRGPGFATATFLDEHTQAALLGPLWGPLYHVVYFGPLMIAVALRWRRIAELAAACGPGVVIALAMTLAFAVSSQSRQWIHLLPLVVALAIAATDEVWTTRRALGFTALALVWAKLWLVIGYDVHVAHLEFPNQRYYMNLGPWASTATYAAHLAAAALTAAALVVLLRSPPSRAADGAGG